MRFEKKRKPILDDPSVLVVLNKPNSVVSEHFRTVRTNIQYSMIDNNLKTIVITSANASAGKSTVAANLAASFASSERRVLLVDADLRRPSVHKLFNLNNNGGLTKLLTDREMELTELTYNNYSDDLCILNSGAIPPNPAELLASHRMKEVIEEMKESFDLIIFDMPPILAVTDAQIMASNTDGVVYVVAKGQDKKDQVMKSKELLDHVKAKVLGVIFNRAERTEEKYYYYGE